MPVTRTSGQGRPAGVPNKLTALVRAAFEEAFTLLQEDDQTKLAAWARKNPTEFYKLAQRFVPAEINANLQGALRVVSGVPDERADGSDLV